MVVASFDRRIGYIGLGDMGGGIATHLAESGFDITVYDRRAEAVTDVEKAGARAVATLDQLVDATDTVVICVDPESQVLEVVRGMTNRLRRGQTVIVQSSVSPQAVEEAAALTAGLGVQLYDAPVSGNHEDRRQGTLALLVGAAAEEVERDRPLLEAIGRPLYFDSLGAGEVAKLANNAIVTVVRLAVAELMSLAAEYGLAERDLRSALACSSGSSWVVDHWDYLDEKVASGYFLRQATRQIAETLEIARRRGVELSMLEAAREHAADIDIVRYVHLNGTAPDFEIPGAGSVSSGDLQVAGRSASSGPCKCVGTQIS